MTDETIPRRKFLVGAGLAGTAVAAGLTQTGRAGASAGGAGSCDRAAAAGGAAAVCLTRPSTRSSSRRSIR